MDRSVVAGANEHRLRGPSSRRELPGRRANEPESDDEEPARWRHANGLTVLVEGGNDRRQRDPPGERASSGTYKHVLGDGGDPVDQMFVIDKW